MATRNVLILQWRVLFSTRRVSNLVKALSGLVKIKKIVILHAVSLLAGKNGNIYAIAVFCYFVVIRLKTVGQL